MYMKALFCYRISKEADMFMDPETGEPGVGYTSFSLDDNDGNIIDIPEDTYHKIHSENIKLLSGLMEIQEDWLEPISIEEYEEE